MRHTHTRSRDPATCQQGPWSAWPGGFTDRRVDTGPRRRMRQPALELQLACPLALWRSIFSTVAQYLHYRPTARPSLTFASTRERPIPTIYLIHSLIPPSELPTGRHTRALLSITIFLTTCHAFIKVTVETSSPRFHLSHNLGAHLATSQLNSHRILRHRYGKRNSCPSPPEICLIRTPLTVVPGHSVILTSMFIIYHNLST